MQRQFGFLNVHKPKGITSHDVVLKVRMLAQTKQVGHGGTLDPLAQGVLPIALGKATRLFPYLSGEKIYRAEVLFGIQTTTDDIEGEILASSSKSPTESEIKSVLGQFIGEISQAPPLYSAIHFGGKRLYQLAREGASPSSVAKRTVTVNSIQLLGLKDNVLELRIDCLQGTYIRSIARDLGIMLNCGGCLKSLVREKAGPFRLDEAHSLELLSELSHSGRFAQALINPLSILAAANGRNFSVDSSDAQKLAMGQSLPLNVVQPLAASDSLASSDLLALFAVDESNRQEPVFISCEQELVAVCKIKENDRIYPQVVVVTSANEIS